MPRAGDLMDRPNKAGDLLDDPVIETPPFEFGGGRSRGGAGGGGFVRRPYPGPEEPALEPQYPLENVAALLPGARAARLVEVLGPRAPALLRSALANAAGSVGFGLVEGTASGRNPLPQLPEYAATGAVLGPAFEAGGRTVMRGVGALSRRLRPPRVQADLEMTPAPVARNAAPVAAPARPAQAPRGPEYLDEDVARMSHEEIVAAHEAQKAYERGSAVRAFGEEGAKRYEKLDRARNNPYDNAKADAAQAEIEKMEAGLSPQQERDLFGIGEKGMNAEDLGRARRASEGYQGIEDRTDRELTSDVGRAFVSGGSALGAVADRIRMQRVMAEVVRRGWAPERVQEIIRHSAQVRGIEPEDAMILVRSAMERGGNKPQPTIRIAPPASATEPPYIPPGVTPPPVPRQPFTGESAQQQIEPLRTFYEQVQKDPAYLARLRELGGGREHTNPETIARALQEGPIPIAELAAWPAETPTNAVLQTRGLLTKDFFQQQWKQAIERGDAGAARQHQQVLAAIEPGVQNLRATPGRALQAQAMFVQDRVTAEVEKLADLQAKGVPFDQMRDAIAASRKSLSRQGLIGRATARFTDAIRAFETYATAAKLTSPVTHAVNTVSNGLTVGFVRPVEKGLTAAALLGQGKPAEALGKIQALYGTSTGFQSGVRRWSEAMFGDALDVGKAEVQRGLPFKGKARLLDPFRQLGAADAFWKGILEDSELHQRAFASAYQQGLRGQPLAARVAELVNDPPAPWLAAARDRAKEYTFQEDPDGFLRAVSGLRNIPGARLIVPFIQTPYNIAKFHAQRSPLGVASGRNLRGIAEGGEKQAEALARLATGTAFSLAAYFTVLRGEVTGAYPIDKAEREVWEAEGRKPYSVKIGPRWLAYNRFQPVGLYLGQAAALKQALDAGNERGAAAIFGKMTASAGKQMLDLPFVSGMSGLMDALQDPEHFGERFVSQTVTGLVPNILRDVRQQTDVAQREARGIVPSVENMLPGVSQRLPQKVDVLGRGIEYDPNRLARASKVLTLPRTSPETEALRTRLEQRNPPAQVAANERAEFERERRSAAGAAVNMVIRQEGFADLPQDQQARLLDRAVERAHLTVRNRWKERGKFAATK